MAGKNVHEMDLGTPAVATDELYATRSPYGVGDDVRIPMSAVAEFVDEATGIHGVVSLGNNATGGTVTGLDLDYAPVAVLLTVQIPSGGGVLLAVLVGTPTTDGFEFALSGMTDSTNYKVHYHCFFP